MPHQKSWSEISGWLLMKSTWYIFVFIQTLLTYIIKLSWRKALILFYSLSINTINSLFVNTLKTLIHVYKWVSNLVSNSSLHKHTIRLSIGTGVNSELIYFMWGFVATRPSYYDTYVYHYVYIMWCSASADTSFSVLME